MSWNSIGKQSVDVRTSSAVRSSGGGLPCSRHQRKIGSDFPSSVGESRSITHSTFKSELRSFQSPIRLSRTELPKPAGRQKLLSAALPVRKVFVPFAPYQLLLAPPPPNPPPPKP